MKKKDRNRPLIKAAADLEVLQVRLEALSIENELVKARREVLEATIQDQDHVTAFKQAMQAKLEAGPEEPTDLQLPASTSYVVRLINRAQPALVQQVLDWEAADWHTWLADAVQHVCLLLQLTERSSQADGVPPAYVSSAEQDLNKAIDDIVTVGALGSIYLEAVGSRLGVCTALNHITMQQEAPPQDHFRFVLQQLQLSRAQLMKLAACYHEFMRQRKVHHALQESLAQAVASTSSCTQRLLAAAHAGSPVAAAVGTSTGSSTTQRVIVRRCASAVDSSRRSGSEAGSSDADAAAAEPADPPGAEELLLRLLVRVNQSFCMPFLVLHDTLTHKQIARMLVASYPFVPRPAPLMEAACQHLDSIIGGIGAAAALASAPVAPPASAPVAAGEPAPAMQAAQQ